MRVMLEISDGPDAGRLVDVTDGQTVSVGRTSKSQLMLPHDNYLSGTHFSVEARGGLCVLRDANSSNGTYVNEERVNGEVELHDGDAIAAGQTRFRVRFDSSSQPHQAATLQISASELIAGLEDRGSVMQQAVRSGTSGTAVVPAMMEKPVAPAHKSLVEFLRRGTVPLYALVDVGADSGLSLALARGSDQYQSLMQGSEVGQGSPSLVHFAPGSRLLGDLIQQAWGRSRLTFLTCNHPFEALRRHLRSFYSVRTEDGRPFRFRFQDPRLLQAFLSGCTEDEVTQFFGPVQSFIAEDNGGGEALVEFSVSPVGLQRRNVRL